MILLIYGQDTYRSKLKLIEIIDHYKQVYRNGLSLKFCDLKTDDYQVFSETVRQSSMFQENKLVVSYNAFQNSEFKGKFTKNLKRFLNISDVIVFYEENTIAEKDSFLKSLRKVAKVQEFKSLDQADLKEWIKKEVSNLGARIEFQAVDKLVSLVGNNLWRLSNEIKKLGTFRCGKEITANDVELFVRPKIDTDIFRTIDAVAQQNKKLALMLLNKHIENGDSPHYLLAMISFQFRNLLIVRDLMEKKVSYPNMLKMSKLNPFVLKKSYVQAQKFSLFELKKIYHKIFQVDFDTKTGKTDPESALNLLIVEI